MPQSNASRTSTLSRRSTAVVERPAVTIPPLDSSVWDNIYELNPEGKCGSHPETEEAHGSVIGHILSQLRPGMDLTKVALPTWILERRSLLEMFADFFVHPDEFTAIAHAPTPAERMTQCLRWYLSSFLAGRPWDVAKKPYNPIIGETFTCWIPKNDNGESTNSEEEGATGGAPGASASVGGGPVPDVAEDAITFVAEQVSHRPPVSCFYTESKADKISMTSHIWTKSRYLGLSIGMECVGQGNIIVHDHNEEYVVTFPKAYGRSILTTPWFEMGGTCHINCEKTGYSAKIDFHEKPLIGGERHRISAEIKAPKEKHPILKLEGHWNDKIYVIEAANKNESAKRKKNKDHTGNEVFVDPKALPTIKKQTFPLESQLETESRRQWREVTWCLKQHIVEGASYFKTALEEKQRAGERNRQERGIKWTPKLFHQTQDGGYVYCSPLEKRLRGDYSTGFK